MKFTPEIVQAFEKIISAAENDFEMHRIGILLKDLTSPPTPEIIDENHQKFNDIIYKKNKYGHFADSGFLHRAVWTYYNGEIKENLQIH